MRARFAPYSTGRPLRAGFLLAALVLLRAIVVAQPESRARAPLKPDLPLTGVAEIKGWAELADQALPVVLEGVVTVPARAGNFFLHDGRLGIHVGQSENGKRLKPGDRVRVSGVTRRGAFAPSIEPQEIISLGRGELPEPRRANLSEIATGTLDGHWLQLVGVVCETDFANDTAPALTLALDGRRLRVILNDAEGLNPETLLDAQVRVRGAASGSFNRHHQLVEPLLRVPGPAFLERLRSPPDPFSLPIMPLSRLMGFSLETPSSHRVRIRATVTRCLSGNVLFVRGEHLGLKVKTREPALFQPGDMLDVAGFPTMAAGCAMLENASCRVVSREAAPIPAEPTWPQILDGSHRSDLVSVRARLVDAVSAGENTTLILQTDNRLFRAMLPHPLNGRNTLPERNSVVLATGICEMGEVDDAWRDNRRAFLLLIAGPEDLTVVERAAWWTAERLGWALALVLLLLLAGAGWVLSLRRQVRRKTAVIEQQSRHAAVLEERSRIARDLHDTLEQGLTGLSLQLKVVELDSQDAPHQVGAGLEAARKMLRESRALAHNAIRELRTDDVSRHHEPLATGLHRIAETWRQSGLEVVVALDGADDALPAAAERELIRIAGEAVTNAVKHGHATRVAIRVRQEPNRTHLDIEDDGGGFGAADADDRSHGGLGLVGMRERAEAIGARLEILPRDGAGARISVDVPAAVSSPLPMGR